MVNPLTELIPALYRRRVYLFAGAAMFLYGLWEAAAGDIRTFVISLVSALVSGLAASNTHPQGDPEIALEDDDFSEYISEE